MAWEPGSDARLPEVILVTGGAGFIGSHLCESLLSAGKRVICLDNFDSFYPRQRKLANLRNCLADPNFTLVEADITQPEALERAINGKGIEAVAHLAALAGVRPSLREPERYAKVNVMGTLNLLQACVRHDIHDFIFASSSSVYGNNRQHASSEDDRVDKPLSPYAATKIAGELLCHTWHRLHGMSALCLRFFTVYGPRQRPDLAIHKFLALLSREEPLPVYGDGSSSRDYTYISDTVAGITAALACVHNQAEPMYQIVNLGNDREIRLAEMIEALEQVSGLQARINRLPAQTGDPERTHANIGKAEKLLGYRPQTPFREGLKMFWQWWRKEGSAGRLLKEEV